MNNHERAQEIYNRFAQCRTEEYIQTYGKLTGVRAATIEEIEAHLDMVAEISREFGFEINGESVAWGATRDDVVAMAEAKRKTYNRRAGVRALERKYGHDAADRIVYQHSGRHIR